ncbi:saccharopine dehydrogenase NADP-binding domain-containing protein [Nocardia sp. IBHARD005]|uniref:saccharopine dehydrogenase NADP-binding domain-containing protein n=1 Tax=Nocardia sp. IBHARD005 TaxID=3457765 RepID=UPI0040598FDA
MSILICGATGHTGRRTAQQLVEAGEKPLLAGRNLGELHKIADQLGGCPVAVVDLERPESIRDLLSPGDVLVSTVGPFATVGDAPIQAAIDAGAHYIDSTGEPPFIRKVFEHYGPRAADAGTVLLPAFGYDFVPGNLAAALALREAGADAVRVDVGYFLTGARRAAAGPAAQASLAKAMSAPMYAWQGHRIVDEPGGARMRTFAVDGTQRPGLSIGATEHLALPSLFGQLSEVNVYLGWFGPATGLLHTMSRFTPTLTRLPFGARVIEQGAYLAIRAGTTEPTPASMASTRCWFAAAAYDAAGAQLCEVALTGPHHMTFTTNIIAWAAQELAARRVRGAGALGPVNAFGIDTLHDGCVQAGLALHEETTL